MRLSFSRSRNFPLGLIVAGCLAVLFASSASAEPHATTPGTELDQTEPSADQTKPSAPAGAQDDGLASQPQPVYPDGEPDIDTVESDFDPADSDSVVEEPKSKVVLTVDKSTQEMNVFVDDVELYTWPVSTGLPGYATPAGTFATTSMNKIWYSKQWDNAPMPHAIFFTKKGHAIHGTAEAKKLGSPASKGCIRLSEKNAESLFNLVKENGLENTELVITGSTPGGDYTTTQPRPRDRGYARRDDRYGYYEPPPRFFRKRRFFQPYYQAPPRQYRPPARRFRAPGY